MPFANKIKKGLYRIATAIEKGTLIAHQENPKAVYVGWNRVRSNLRAFDTLLVIV